MARKNESRTYEEKLEESLVPDWEQPYKVPSNWLWTRLGELITEVKNGTTIKQDKTLEGFNVTRIESLQHQTIDFNRLGVIVDESKIKDSDWYEKGDIALSHINSAEHVGKTALITEDMLPLVHGMNLLRLRFNTLFDPKLFQLFSQSFQYKQSVIERINMAVNQVSINQKQLCTIEVPLPPVPEQQRIVERIESLFSKLDEAKDKAQTALDSFENRKAVILHRAFTGELTKKWREENGVSRDGWEKGVLSDFLLKMTAKKPAGEIFRYIDIDAIDNKNQKVSEPKVLQVSDAPSRASREVMENDTLFSMVRPYLRNIAFIDHELSDCIASTGFYVCRPKKSLHPRFLYYFLCSKDAIDYLMQFMKGDNSPSIRGSNLEEMPFKMPSIPEQIEIIRILDSIFDKEQQAKEIVNVIEKIDLMKKAILSRAFRGELGTNKPEEESVLVLLKEMLSEEKITEQKSNKKQIIITNSISKQFKTDLEEQIYRIILANQNSTLNQILSSISSSKHLDAMEAIAILYEKGLIKNRGDLYSTK